jgi:hypothetical protein
MSEGSYTQCFNSKCPNKCGLIEHGDERFYSLNQAFVLCNECKIDQTVVTRDTNPDKVLNKCDNCHTEGLYIIHMIIYYDI